MKNLATIFIIFLFILNSNIYPQKTVKTTKFSSRYTNLEKDCKTIGGGEGTDDASDCRGIGGYRIQIYAAAAMLIIVAQPPVKKALIQLASQDFDFDGKKHTVEWRMADGKPFAVIMRVAEYGDRDNESPSYFGKKIGETLIVRGLQGFEDLILEIDAKTPNANKKAREMADNGYKQK